jgi:outer membrane protein OmpA-like peptidoglycan-associated protein
LRKNISIVVLLFFVTILSAQINVEGFVFETGNRGYLNQAKVTIKDQASGQVYCDVATDAYGQFKCSLPPIAPLQIVIEKPTYKPFTKTLTADDLKSTEINYIKAEMERAPGYLFEITLAERKDSANQIVDAVVGTLIEVYNNTTEKEIIKLENHPSQEFKVNLEKGNHYTILIRKAGYLAKQMEVYVNVKGCILCFEGISDVRPGVTDNLTAKNEYGVLLANVEMDKVYSGKSIEVKNIMYAMNSATLVESSKKELDKVINLLKYNPNLSIELGSHTDSRGTAELNLSLSDKRAKAAVDYIVSDPLISKTKIKERGYGEYSLLNKCKDGVVCSEAEHALNRRTEIKVTGLSEDWVFKPLINIKTEEKFQKEYLNSSKLGGDEYKKSPADSTTKSNDPKSEATESKVNEGKVRTLPAPIQDNAKTVNDTLAKNAAPTTPNNKKNTPSSTAKTKSQGTSTAKKNTGSKGGA